MYSVRSINALRPLCRTGVIRLCARQSRVPLPPRRALWTKTGTSYQDQQDQQSWLKYALAFSTLAAGSWILATHEQGKIQLDGKPFKRYVGADPALTPQAHETAHHHSCSSASFGNLKPDNSVDVSTLPREKAVLTTAPEVPPPIERDHPALVEVALETTTKLMQITSNHKYETWTFNDSVPGPFIRARAGDVLELSLTNRDESGNPHNVDFHSVLGPGGGSAITTASEGETKTARFKLLCPGLYIYHCAAAPVPVHIANGMYGLIYVQPEEANLPAVDREYYVMQSEFYHEPPEKDEATGRPLPTVEFSYPNALREEPSAVVFNGHEAAVTRDKPLKARVGETVRIFFGNAGPNLTSSFHVIGSNFNRLYREGDVVSPPAQFVQTTSVAPGSATIVDMKMVVPGTYTLLDHAIFRIDKGAIGYLNVSGEPKPEIYQGTEPPAPCVGCKLHP